MQACHTDTGWYLSWTGLGLTTKAEARRTDPERATALHPPHFRTVVKARKHNAPDDQWTGAILEVSVLCIMNLLLFLLPYFACFFL